MNSQTTIRTADALARRLYAAGCRYAFGMPGGEVLTLVDALEDLDDVQNVFTNVDIPDEVLDAL